MEEIAKWNVDFEFSVGQTETHQIRFSWDQWRGEAKLVVDGQEALRDLRERHEFLSKRVKRFEISVGESEVHSVIVEQRIPKLYGGIRKHTFRVLIDDILLSEH
jgi:hypothetical protein